MSEYLKISEEIRALGAEAEREIRPYFSRIEEICDRMNTVRNGIAHSRLDLNLEAVHLSDLKIIEELLYAMRLQHLRVDTKSIQIGIKRLFGERISIE